MITKDKQIVDVWGVPIYEGNVIMIIDGGTLTPRIVYKMTEHSFMLLNLQQKVCSYKVDDKIFKSPSKAFSYASDLVGYTPKKSAAGHILYPDYRTNEYKLYHKAQDKIKGIYELGLKASKFQKHNTIRQKHVVVVENALFKLNLDGFGQLFELVDKAKSIGVLPENYKIGKRIVHVNKKTVALFEEEGGN